MTHKYAVKTGTTDTDILIFGYNPDLLVGIWSGYDNNSTIASLESSGIKNMWVYTMEDYSAIKINMLMRLYLNCLVELLKKVKMYMNT